MFISIQSNVSFRLNQFFPAYTGNTSSGAGFRQFFTVFIADINIFLNYGLTVAARRFTVREFFIKRPGF
jgi:hypothetical protein